MIELTDDQRDLLIAMYKHGSAKISNKRRKVLVRNRKFDLKDLLVLRAAQLINREKPSYTGADAAFSYSGFYEITDMGIKLAKESEDDKNSSS